MSSEQRFFDNVRKIHNATQAAREDLVSNTQEASFAYAAVRTALQKVKIAADKAKFVSVDDIDANMNNTFSTMKDLDDSLDKIMRDLNEYTEMIQRIVPSNH